MFACYVRYWLALLGSNHNQESPQKPCTPYVRHIGRTGSAYRP